MSETGAVLVVDADADAAARTSRRLEDAGYETSAVTGAATSDVGLDRTEGFDCVVVESELEDRDGIAFAEAVDDERDDVDIVVYTGSGNEAVASRAVTAGVDEYVRKSRGPQALLDALDRVTDSEQKADRDPEAASATTADPDFVESLLQISPGGLVIVGDDGRITYANERGEDVLGLEPSELESRRYDDPEWEITDLEGEPLDEAGLPFRRVVDSGEPVYGMRIGIETSDGDRKCLSVNGAPLSDDVEAGAVAFSFTDVTDRVERERELERYRTIVDTVDDVIYALDEEGQLVLANRTLADYLDRDLSELIGTDVEELLPPDAYARGAELVRSLDRSDGADHGRYEFEIERNDGERRFFENNVGVLGDEGFGGSVGVIRDITRRKRQAKALERQNEHLDEFISIVSHDLRGPLNVIQGTVETVRQTGNLERLERIENRAERMDAMITDLLELARQGRAISDIEDVSLERAVVDAWRNVDTGDADLTFDDELGRVEADPDRLQQLLENLFRNAVIHGTGEAVAASTAGTGGCGDGRPTRTISDRDLTVAVERTDDGFVVADDGRGIDPAVADELFERGVTTRDDGTGYGLDIVQRIVEAHGWTVEVVDGYDGAAFLVET